MASPRIAPWTSVGPRGKPWRKYRLTLIICGKPPTAGTNAAAVGRFGVKRSSPGARPQVARNERLECSFILIETSTQGVRSFNPTFQSGPLLSAPFSLAPKHVGRKEIPCAPSSNRHPRPTAPREAMNAALALALRPLVTSQRRRAPGLSEMGALANWISPEFGTRSANRRRAANRSRVPEI
jgi:hypothetical protein